MDDMLMDDIPMDDMLMDDMLMNDMLMDRNLNTKMQKIINYIKTLILFLLSITRQ